MPRATQILRKSCKAVEDLNLIKVLQSEISQELSSSDFKDKKADSPRDFVLEWDSSQSQDVFLRRKSESGEEVAISALLERGIYSLEGIFPWKVLMKVCVKKPGLNSILQFDCRVSEKVSVKTNSGLGSILQFDSGFLEKEVCRSDFNIYSAYYLQSKCIPTSSIYRGPLFSSLDPKLQGALKEYLVAKGIGEDLTNFLLLTLHKKEKGQYLDWLRKLESFVGKED